MYYKVLLAIVIIENVSRDKHHHRQAVVGCYQTGNVSGPVGKLGRGLVAASNIQATTFTFSDSNIQTNTFTFSNQNIQTNTFTLSASYIPINTFTFSALESNLALSLS